MAPDLTAVLTERAEHREEKLGAGGYPGCAACSAGFLVIRYPCRAAVLFDALFQVYRQAQADAVTERRRAAATTAALEEELLQRQEEGVSS